MRLSIIGAGRVGQALGRLAFAAGYEIGDVVCRTEKAAKSAVRFIGAGEPASASGAAIGRAELTLISTPDDSIPAAVELLLRRQGLSGESHGRRPARWTSIQPRSAKPKVALHTSGALSSKVLGPLTAQGFSVGSCHPLQTFESPQSAIEIISRSYFCIEGDERARRAARVFVRKIGGRSFEVDTGRKELYHAGAVLASGGLVALLSISLEILTRCGLSERQARRVLIPLVEGTVANVNSLGPAGALTGPVRRRDAGTIKRNLSALAGENLEWQELYQLLARRGSWILRKSGSARQTDQSLLDDLLES